MTDTFLAWLAATGLTLSGHDDDGDGDFDGYDDDSDDSDDGASDRGSSRKSDDGDDRDSGDDANDADDDDLRADLKAKDKKIAKLERDLEDALEMIEEAETKRRRRGDDDYDDDDTEYHELRDENDKLRALLNGPYIRSQISSFRDKDGNPKWDWEDPETVFALLKTADLEVDVETGEIDGLEEQLRDLARNKPFLLRQRSSRRGASGKVPGGSSDKKKPSREDLASDFSAFNTMI
ncbi:hypothetical protein GUMBALL_13 [Mycobacterium phage Gumball]|uniref:Scaffolding protein n=2 Tax=Plotvirus plot TaxID=2170099 RepID=B5U3P1_9CAUD|nr:head scaffolding protein [Mycobacterium phage Gumball]ACI06387.1 hypothetical protein GUMBALL_13 [Mycobacterium phage Gumball]AEK10223.1 hypothetical protein PBI_SIRHARLEY_13 [Mycobacterium phage SirHarley]